MSFRVSASIEGERYAAAPETAVLWGVDGAYIWTVVAGVATRTPVQVIQRRDGRILIDGDLAARGVVVVEGTQRMRDGISVSYDEKRLAGSGDIARYSEGD